MKRQILLLNADHNLVSLTPISMINWENAIKLWFTGVATPIHYYDDWVVHSPSMDMAVPSVLALTNYKNIKRAVKFTSKNVFLRDDYICQYFHVEFPASVLTRDHVKPRANGGQTRWENITTACGPCNNKRGHKEHIRPLHEPRRPTIYEINSKLTTRPITAHHESWIPYLQVYWEDNNIKVLEKRVNIAS